MNIKNPAISVVMPVYNADKYLEEAINSILNQTLTDFEFIIINDGSTDRSVEIIKSFQDERIVYIDNEENIKLVKSLNKGLSIAKGKYIARMDADDISLPERLMCQFDFMEKHPCLGACGSWSESFGDEIAILKYDSEYNKIRFKMLYQLPVLHPSVIIRKEVLQRFGLEYDINYIQCEDYDLFVRIAEVSKISNIPLLLIKYRRHGLTLQALHNEDFVKYKQKVIAYQFSKMGFEISNSEIDLFTRFCYNDFSFSKENIEDLEVLLNKMISANYSSNYIDHFCLTNSIGEKWFHLIYNMVRKERTFIKQKYQTAQFSKYYKPNKTTRFKFFIKRMF